jgi:RNA polymerase sigma-70 factor (ECF subfamily)
MATNAWIDRTRRDEPDALPDGWDAPAAELAPTAEVREGLERLARVLPPRERAAVLLVDVFDLTLDETASLLEMTVGAVKAALHRARGKLARARDLAPERAPARERLPDERVDRFVSAFNARDLDGLAALFLDDAQARVIGMVQEYGREQIAKGSLHHTIFDEEGAPRVERALFRGEPVLLVWYEKGTRAVEDVIRLAGDGRGIVALDYYYFCPEVLAEVGAALSVPIRTNGHRYQPVG